MMKQPIYNLFQGTDTASVELRLVRKYMHAPTLDVGAADGAFADAANASGFIVHSCDPAPKNSRVEKASLDQMAARGITWATVTCWQCLEHIDNHDDALRQLVGLVSPGGSLIVSVPANEDMTLNECNCPACGLAYHRWGHKRSWTASGLGEAMLNAGLEVRMLRVYPVTFAARIPLGRWLWPIAMLIRDQSIHTPHVIGVGYKPKVHP